MGRSKKDLLTIEPRNWHRYNKRREFKDQFVFYKIFSIHFGRSYLLNPQSLQLLT